MKKHGHSFLSVFNFSELCMRIDDVYLVNLGKVVNDEINYNNNTLKVKECDYGRTIVYKTDNKYIDLRSGKKYKKNDTDRLNIGDIFIDMHKGLKPIRTILNEVNQASNNNTKIKDNMPKRKILKMFR